MSYEYDSNKSESNKQKHGVSFTEAQAIWLSDNVILPAITRGEPRYMIIGKIYRIVYSCIFTLRAGNIRIISCRRSREKERVIYDEAIKR